jgi:outer membrane protein insertion porin family
MRKLPFSLLAAGFLGTAAGAQESAVAGRCATPDAVAFRGMTRTPESALRAETGITPGTAVNYRDIQRAVRNLFATGQFDDVRAACELSDGGNRATLVFDLRERPLLSDIEVRGVDRVSTSDVRDRIELLVARPIDPSQVARAVARIDSLYESKGYYLARIDVDTTISGGNAKLTFTIDEGNRLAVSGVRVRGARAVSQGAVVGAMKTKPEGFLWWRKGEFDEDEYQGDLAERIPQLYANRGFIDARVVRDTLIVDRERGKALVEVTVEEGRRYRVGSFEPTGATRFSREEIARFYPFGQQGRSFADWATSPFRRSDNGNGGEIFDRGKWEEATRNVQQAYANEGYIYATVTPVVERTRQGRDSVPTVNLRWDIEERQPAIVNRVEILGNDVTTETCIREQIFVLPGDVFNQDLLIRSYHNIANLGFFETPLPSPDTRQANERGDVDIVFRVKEKRTGSVNFGASVGQGTGVGGFIGFEQPNLFGLCKRGSLQWQFGRYINDFNLGYTDPAIQQTRISGTVNAYHSQNRFIIQGLGRQVRTGGQLQLGFPVPRSRFSRFFVSYGGERVDYGDDGLLQGAVECRNCFRSTLGMSLTRDTRIDMPFPSAGANQSLSAQFTGGPLGGTAAFQRYTGEMRSYATLAAFGGGRPGAGTIKLVTGLSSRAGVLFGNAGPFYLQRFSLGGVQFGEPLRGYEEFSITPRGYQAGGDQFRARPESFGNAFFTTTAELGIRFGPQLYVNAFYDAGNIWARPQDFDPTRLFRGAGVGASLVTPLGPLGLDLGYGFDRRDLNDRPAPRWQLHFRLGQFF